MQRNKTFVVVLALLVFGLVARAQTGVAVVGQGAPGGSIFGFAGLGWSRLDLKAGLDLNKLIRNPLPVYTDPFAQPWAIGAPGGPVSALADDYYCLHFGFFCKKELEFEKTTHIPLRFRLGSLEQCNALEGKK